MHRITHDQRNDVAAVIHDGQAEPLEPGLEDPGLGLMAFAQGIVGLQMRDRGRRTGRDDGGREVVKMNPGA